MIYNYVTCRFLWQKVTHLELHIAKIQLWQLLFFIAFIWIFCPSLHQYYKGHVCTETSLLDFLFNAPSHIINSQY